MLLKKSLATIAMISFLSSCATQRFYISENPQVGMPNHEKMQHFFISGLGQTQEVNAKDVCNGKEISHVEAHLSFLDGLLGALTYGIYTPRTAKVFCKG